MKRPTVVALALLGSACAAGESLSARALREIAPGRTTLHELVKESSWGGAMSRPLDDGPPGTFRLVYVDWGLPPDPLMFVEIRDGVVNGYMIVVEPDREEAQAAALIAPGLAAGAGRELVLSRLGPPDGVLQCPTSLESCPSEVSILLWRCPAGRGWLSARMTGGALQDVGWARGRPDGQVRVERAGACR